MRENLLGAAYTPLKCHIHTKAFNHFLCGRFSYTAFDLRELEEQINAVKGVGEKRAEEIMQILGHWLGVESLPLSPVTVLITKAPTL